MTVLWKHLVEFWKVSTSEREVLLRCDVEGHFTRVRVWTDHPTEPDHILIVLG